MSKHTPGPWFTDHNDPTRVCKQFRSGRVVNETIAKTAYAWMTNAERLANARLIAAAPELLEALEVLLNNNESLVGEKTARAAYAKATQP
jgi:hypothetical protein